MAILSGGLVWGPVPRAMGLVPWFELLHPENKRIKPETTIKLLKENLK